VEIDLERFLLRKAGKHVPVEPKSLKLLIFLAESHGRLIERQELIDAVWSDAIVTDHVLNRSIGQLRKALSDDPKEPRYIETVPTLGYRFIAEVEVAEEATAEPSAAAHGSADKTGGHAKAGAEPAAALGIPSGLPRPWVTGVAILLGCVLVTAVAVTALKLVSGTASARSSIRSMAVLPLKNISGDPAQDYLADGMTEELITDLGQIGALRVISPTTAMQYKDPHKPLPEIARELHVDAVVEGSVARAGDRLHVNIQLIDARADRQIWASSYEGDLRDAFTLQNQVSSAVADEIRIKLTTQERTKLASSRETNSPAHEALLKGYFFENNTTPESELKAMQYFKQAAQLDPHYARAYVGIGRSYNFLANSGSMATGEATADADAAVAKALEIDPDLGEAYAERGWMEMFYHWDMPAAARDFRHALELDPSDSSFHEGLAHYLVITGQFDEGLREILRAVDLDPLSRRTHTDACMLFSLAKRYEEAVGQCKAALELDPNFQWALDVFSDVYERKGDYAAAHELMKRGVCFCTSALCMAKEDEIHGAPGKRGSFDAWLKSQTKAPDAIDLAYAYAGLGRKSEAFASMERAYEQHQGMQQMTFWGGDPFFAKLYSDPRFDEFLRHAGLPPRPRAGDFQTAHAEMQ
jgi:TolB-like protein/DNA-binding winged helix-turn-helix (wHTH) protein/Tfp pilus assembly protein PilF